MVVALKKKSLVKIWIEGMQIDGHKAGFNRRVLAVYDTNIE